MFNENYLKRIVTSKIATWVEKTRLQEVDEVDKSNHIVSLVPRHHQQFFGAETSFPPVQTFQKYIRYNINQ